MLARLSYTIACLIWELWLYDLNLCSENRKWGTLQLRGQKDFTQIMSALLIILTERECPTSSILKTPKVFPKKRPPKVSSPASGKLLLPKIGITGMFILLKLHSQIWFIFIPSTWNIPNLWVLLATEKSTISPKRTKRFCLFTVIILRGWVKEGEENFNHKSTSRGNC